MTSGKIIRVSKPLKKLAEEPQSVFQDEQQVKTDVDDIELDIEQPTPLVQLESLVESYLDESVYGSGWSVTELLNEFSDM
ncbi:hypothetical protein IQ230_19545 [Gloeocapsopsis crepidinum LEGE 06123]|uniref:Uncharacterized protein n=2 Tax=Gloeocapsopsis crepidinum TaxID=693223 RepID=A0ABR9UZ41_9CHRO|nr:hypothetical protein [Gloeocapsopsis crepidinum LEGE 06123]